MIPDDDPELDPPAPPGDTTDITPPPPVELAAGAPDAEPPALVKARWVGAQPTWNPEQGVIAYGDPVDVTVEQLEDPNTTAVPWDDAWAPDSALAELCAAALPAPADEEA